MKEFLIQRKTFEEQTDVYKITCDSCDKLLLGKTSRAFKNTSKKNCCVTNSSPLNRRKPQFSRNFVAMEDT